MNMNAQLRVLKVLAIILFQVVVMSAISPTNGQVRAKEQDRNLNQDSARTGVQEKDVTPLSPADEESSVGNVYGSVVDAETGKPLPGVEIVLTKDPAIRSKKASRRAIASNDGYVTLPEEINSSNFKALTDESGEFLINSIPAPYPDKPYTIIVTMPGYVSQIQLHRNRS